MRIENNLPRGVAIYYEKNTVWKATKHGTSTIIIQTKKMVTDVWKKNGTNPEGDPVWHLQPKPKPRPLAPPAEPGWLFGQKIPDGAVPKEE